MISCDVPPVSSKVLKKLDTIISGARDIRLYDSLYSDFYSRHYSINTIEDFKRLPMMDDRSLSKARLSDTVRNPNDISETRYPLDGERNASGMLRVLNFDDMLMEYSVLDFLLDSIGCIGSQTAMILTDERHNYSMSEFAKEVAFLHEKMCAFVVRDHSSKELRHELEIFNPTLVISYAGSIKPKEILPDSVKYFVTVNTQSPVDSNIDSDSFRSYDIFKHPMMGMIGVMDRKKGFFEFDPMQFYIENVDSNLVFTSMIQNLQPMIRYSTGDKGTVFDKNKFVVEARGDYL